MPVGLLSGQVFSPFWRTLAHGESWGRRHKSLSRGGIGGSCWLSSVVTSRTWIGRSCVCHLCLRRSVGFGNCGRRRCLRLYGGVCILQACWHPCLHIPQISWKSTHCVPVAFSFKLVICSFATSLLCSDTVGWLTGRHPACRNSLSEWSLSSSVDL